MMGKEKGSNLGQLQNMLSLKQCFKSFEYDSLHIRETLFNEKVHLTVIQKHTVFLTQSPRQCLAISFQMFKLHWLAIVNQRFRKG